MRGVAEVLDGLPLFFKREAAKTILVGGTSTAKSRPLCVSLRGMLAFGRSPYPQYRNQARNNASHTLLVS